MEVEVWIVARLESVYSWRHMNFVHNCGIDCSIWQEIGSVSKIEGACIYVESRYSRACFSGFISAVETKVEYKIFCQLAFDLYCNVAMIMCGQIEYW